MTTSAEKRSVRCIFLSSIALSVVAAVAISCSTDTSDSESAELVYPLSEFSDQTWVEMALPWSEIVSICPGIGSMVPTGGFARSGETVEITPGEAMVLSEYSEAIWSSSRILHEGSRGDENFRLLNLEISYLKDEGFGAAQLEVIEQFDYDVNHHGTALVAKSVDADGHDPAEVTHRQIYIFDSVRVASVVVITSPGVTPYCDKDELETLVDVIVTKLK